jgi:hypothetical protein
LQIELPIQPPELDEATNPNYTEDFRNQIACMNRKGANIKALPDNQGWTFLPNTESLSAQQEEKVERECIVEAFSAS